MFLLSLPVSALVLYCNWERWSCISAYQLTSDQFFVSDTNQSGLEAVQGLHIHTIWWRYLQFTDRKQIINKTNMEPLCEQDWPSIFSSVIQAINRSDRWVTFAMSHFALNINLISKSHNIYHHVREGRSPIRTWALRIAEIMWLWWYNILYCI